MGPVVVTGILGWGNGDRRGGACAFDAYGPGGRWGKRPSLPGTGAYEGATATRGDHLADALEEAGATEGTRLVVLALPRETPDDVVQRLATEVRALVSPTRAEGAPQPEGDRWLDELLDAMDRGHTATD